MQKIFLLIINQDTKGVLFITENYREYLIFRLISCIFQNLFLFLQRDNLKVKNGFTFREMKRSNIIEARRKHVNPLARQNIDLSFQIVDRIHEILVAKGLKQKDLAMKLDKKEAEISKWMRGTHNFTIDTLVTIEKALGAPILKVVHQEEIINSYEFEPMMASEPLSDPEP